ncbi:MAG TPA: MliC family protein [Stenotrophomonas sp.]|nr:MliC family protein [Stenotrophomonas sp.]
MRKSSYWVGMAVVTLGLSACSKPAEEAMADAAAPVAETAPMATGGDAGAAGAVQPAKMVRVDWICDGKPVTAEYDNVNEQVRLQIGAQALTLPIAVSGSGARYADNAGNEYWEHQGEATLTLAGGKAQQCRKAAAGG